MRNSKDITDKINNEDILFAHISNDSEISGTGLEGGLVQEFCEYLINLNDKLKKQNIDTSLSSLISQISLIKQTAKATSYEESLALIKKSLADSEHNNQNVVFASGWKGCEEYSGHTIIAQLNYDTNKNLLLTIHNNGSGVEYHAKKGPLSSTQLVYKIPKENLNIISLERVIEILIKPHYENIVDIKVNVPPDHMFYVQLSDLMHRLEATKQDAKEHTFSKGQRSGTCTWKTLISFVKTSINDNKKYLFLKYEIKLDTLIRYYDSQRNNNRLYNNRLVREQIVYACENLARLIKKLDKIYSAPNQYYKNETYQERRTIGIEKILEIENELITKIIIEQDLNDNVKFKTTDPIKIGSPLANLGGQENQGNEEEEEEYRVTKEPLHIKIPKFSPSDITNSITKMQNFAINEGIDSLQRLLALEQIINSIELNIKYESFSKSDKMNATKLAREIANLSHIHLCLCSRQNNHLRYDSLIASLTLNMLIIKMSPQIFDISNFKNNHKDAVTAYSFIVDPLNHIKGLLSSEIISYSSTLNHRLEYLRKEFENLIDPFDELCNNHKALEHKKNMQISTLLALFPAEIKSEIMCLYIAFYQSQSIVNCLSTSDLDRFRTNIIIFPGDDSFISDIESNPTIKNHYTYILRNSSPHMKMYITNHKIDATISESFGVNILETTTTNYRINISNSHVLIDDRNAIYSSGKHENLTAMVNKNILKFKDIESYDLKFINDLCSIYLSQDSVTSCIYELICRYPNKIGCTAMQDIIFTCLFTKANIENQLKNSSEGLLSLVELLEKILKIQSNQLDSSKLFIFKLTIYIDGYIQSLSNDNKYNFNTGKITEKLFNIKQEFNNEITKNPNNLKLRMLQAKNIQKASKSNIKDIIVCQLILKSKLDIVDGHPYVPLFEITLIEELLISNKEEITKILGNDPENTFIKEAIEVLNNFSPDIKGNYPLYYYHDQDGDKCEIDLISGKIFYGKEIQTQTPINIFSAPLYKEHFNNKLYDGKLSSNNRCFSFIDENKDSYIINHDGQSLVLQKTFKWPKYNTTYTLLDGKHKEFHILYNRIPSTLIDKNHDIWFNGEYIIITDKENKKDLYYISRDKVLTATQDKILVRIEQDNYPFKNILYFEDQNFIEVWRSDDKPYNYNIKLPRYNIEFESKGENYDFIWKSDPRYKIHLNPSNAIINGFNNYLILTPIDISSGLNKIVLTPVQEIITDTQSNKKKLDINNEQEIRKEIKKSLMENKEYLPEGIDPQETIFNLRNNTSKFNYHSSASFTGLELDKDGELHPRTCQSQLHLAYIFLNTNNTTKSLELLKKSFSTFIGTTEEIMWLSKIISEQPAFIPLTKKEQKLYEQINSSRSSAVKAFASLILANNPQVITKINKNIKNEIATKARMCTAQYYNAINNIPDTMRLDKTQEMLLLQEFGLFVSDYRLSQLRNDLNNFTTEQLFHKKNNYVKKVSKPLSLDFYERAVDSEITGIILKYYNKKNENKYYFTIEDNTFSEFMPILTNIPKTIKILLSEKTSTTRKNLAKNIDIIIKILYDSNSNIYVMKNYLSDVQFIQLKHFFSALKYIEQYSEELHKHKEIVDKLGAFGEGIGDLLAEIKKMFSNRPLYVNYEEELFNEDIPEQLPATIKTRLKIQTLKVDTKDPIDDAIDKILPRDLKLSKIDIVHRDIANAHDNYENILRHDHNNELSIGKSINESEKDDEINNIKKLDDSKIEHIHKCATDMLALSALKKNKNEIIKLANNIPRDKSRNAELSIASRTKHKLTFSEILRLFLQQDLNLYLTNTFLSKDEVKDLHQKIFEYLLEATTVQLLNKIVDATNKIKKGVKDADDLIHVKELASLLTHKRKYKVQENTTLLLFEFLENKLIRADQVKYLDKLLNNHDSDNVNILCQVIMGGGKSKVLLPILAQEKANSDKLSIVVVSKDMYETNFLDLTKSSSELFGQKAIKMLFSRDTNTDDDFFKNLYYKLEACIRDQDYIITTPESLQSLELKYLELLKYAEQYHDNLHYLNEILLIIKNKGDAIIDEADQNLQTKKELNYAMGEKESISVKYPNLPTDAVNFFIFLEKNCDALKYVNGEISLVSDKQKKDYLNTVTDKLLNDSNSILHKIISNTSLTQHLSIKQKETLKKYLTNEEEKLPDFLKSLVPETIERLDFLRKNLSGLLIQTLSKHKNENYGLRLCLTDAIKSNIAVPYTGSQTPSKSSEFASPIENINYTLQSHMGSPIDEKIFKLVIGTFKDRYLSILSLKSHDTIYARKEIQNEFEKITGIKTNLQEVVIDESEELSKLYNSIKNNTLLKEYALINLIIPGISHTNIQEKSNSQDLIRSFHKVGAFTGTPYNYRTLEPFLKFNASLSLGTDGKTIDLIKKKTLGIIESSADDIKSLLTSLKSTEFVRAIIDQGAHCKNISNENMAKNIRDFYITVNTKITHILYFNDSNILTALPMDSNLQAIVLNSTDPQIIYDTIHATPEQCLTYYDQVHSTGVDIKQFKKAQALVTVGKNTILRDLLQSTMRMRELAAEQTMHIVIPKELSHHIKNNKLTIDNIIEFTLNNQIIQLGDEHYTAARQQIKSILRADLLQKLLNAPKEQKLLYINKFTDFFFENSPALLDPVGNGLKKIETAIALENFKNLEIQKWKNALTELNIYREDINNKMHATLEMVITKIIPTCKPKVISGEIAVIGAEQEQEQQKEIQKEQQLENADVLKTPFQGVDITSIFENMLHNNIDTTKLFTMNSVLNDFKDSSWKFDERIYIYIDVFKVFNEQLNIFQAKKEADLVMTIIDNDPINSKYVLISPTNAKHIINYCKNNNISKNIIIQSIHGNENFNLKKLNNTPDDHNEIMQQIAFYNGDADLLDPKWFVKDNHLDKINLLSKIISEHPAKKSLLINLKNSIARFEHIIPNLQSTIDNKEPQYIAYPEQKTSIPSKTIIGLLTRVINFLTRPFVSIYKIIKALFYPKYYGPYIVPDDISNNLKMEHRDINKLNNIEPNLGVTIEKHFEIVIEHLNNQLSFARCNNYLLLEKEIKSKAEAINIHLNSIINSLKSNNTDDLYTALEEYLKTTNRITNSPNPKNNILYNYSVDKIELNIRLTNEISNIKGLKLKSKPKHKI